MGLASVQFKVLACSGSEGMGVHPCSFMLGDQILFDAGSAASLLNIEQQRRLKAIYLTHCHLDHVKDLAFIGENVFSLISEPIVVYAAQGVLNSLRTHLFNNVLWPDFTALPTANNPVFKFQAIQEGARLTPPQIPGVEIEAVAVNHPGPTYGFIIRGPKQALVYTGDTGDTQRLWDLVKQDPSIKDILLEASFPNRLADLAKSSQHLTPQGVATQLAKMGRGDVKIHVYHIKVPYLQEITEELHNLASRQIRLLQPGDHLELG